MTLTSVKNKLSALTARKTVYFRPYSLLLLAEKITIRKLTFMIIHCIED